MRRGEAAVDAPEPPRIAERLGERQRLLEAVQVSTLLAERHQQLAQLEPDVDRLFHGRPGARQMAERRERLVEVCGGRRVRRAARRPRRGSAAPRHRLVPQLTLHRMMGEALDVVVEAVAVELPDRVHHRGMEGAAPGIEQALVGDLVRQRVLEGVLEVRERPRSRR